MFGQARANEAAFLRCCIGTKGRAHAPPLLSPPTCLLQVATVAARVKAPPSWAATLPSLIQAAGSSARATPPPPRQLEGAAVVATSVAAPSALPAFLVGPVAPISTVALPAGAAAADAAALVPTATAAPAAVTATGKRKSTGGATAPKPKLAKSAALAARALLLPAAAADDAQSQAADSSSAAFAAGDSDAGAAAAAAGAGPGGYCRKDKSLGLLTENFMDYCATVPDGLVSLDAAASFLGERGTN